MGGTRDVHYVGFDPWPNRFIGKDFRDGGVGKNSVPPIFTQVLASQKLVLKSSPRAMQEVF